MAVKFKSFSSGSCGNCYWLGTEDEGKVTAGVIIDAGVSLRRLKKELIPEGMDTDSFSAVMVTHDHMDHIRSLGSFCKHLGKPVWATDVLHKALSHHTMTYEYIPGCRRVLKDGEWNEIVPGHISARYFVVPHDATQTVGYALVLDGYRFVIMTDIGHMTEEALSYARNADTVVLESNYDIDMLMGGHYTYDLKMRICRGNGHLSNDECADSVRSFYHPGLRHLFLCHLSENNNTPQLAFEATDAVFRELGIKGQVGLRTLPRQTASPMFILD